MPTPQLNLSIVILIDDEADKFVSLMPRIHSTLDSLAIPYEIMIVACQIGEKIRQVIELNQGKLICPPVNGYGVATVAGIRQATGDYIIFMDADQTHPAHFLIDLWNVRNTADVIIASRYIPNGQALMPIARKVLSKALNIVFSRGLDLNVRDMSSGFRLYKSHVIKNIVTECTDYDILQEILVKLLMEGYLIREIPFSYRSRINDSLFSRLVNFGLAYLKTFKRLWKLRNSIASADYNALMPPQGYWQRQRYKHITHLLAEKGKCLDVGCGSSRIIGNCHRTVLHWIS